jgi:hypothetical protein
MITHTVKSTLRRSLLATVSIGMLGAATLPNALAGCLAPDYRNFAPASWLSRDGIAPRFVMVDREDSPAIVGMWKVTMTSMGNDRPPVSIPDNAQLDEGYQQWHDDGTEIMNSNRDPATSNFCMGVWKQTGRSTFSLNHFALPWSPADPTTSPKTAAAAVGPVRIQMIVTVDPPGDTFKGNFILTPYGTDETTVLLPPGWAGLTGQITGKRVKLNSPASL